MTRAILLLALAAFSTSAFAEQITVQCELSGAHMNPGAKSSDTQYPIRKVFTLDTAKIPNSPSQNGGACVPEGIHSPIYSATNGYFHLQFGVLNCGNDRNPQRNPYVYMNATVGETTVSSTGLLRDFGPESGISAVYSLYTSGNQPPKMIKTPAGEFFEFTGYCHLKKP